MNTVWVLACRRSRICTSIDAALRAISGLPNGPGVQSSPANLSSDLTANRLTTSSWSVDRMLIARWSALNRQSWVDDECWTATITVGGSSEMLAKALTAKPRGVPSSMAVTTVTPVTNCRLTIFMTSSVGGAETADTVSDPD